MNIQNLMSMGMSRQMLLNQAMLQKSAAQLSSGYRINSAADDPAGLAISEKMRAQQAGYDRAIQNAYDGNSMINVADGALGSMNSMLTRLQDLSVQAANGTLNDSQRQIINNEAQNILGEIDRISQSTNFNGINLLDGSLSSESQITVEGLDMSKIADSLYIDQNNMKMFDGTNLNDAKFSINGKEFALVNEADFDQVSASLDGTGVTAIKVDGADAASLTSSDLSNIASTINKAAGTDFKAANEGLAMEIKGKSLDLQIGETADGFNKISISIGDMSSKGLGLKGLDLSTAEGARNALDQISTAIDRLGNARSDLGASYNRIESTINNLGVSYENSVKSESQLRDADMAKAYMKYTKHNMFTQVQFSMMAQANASQQQVLQLLR